MMFRLLTETVSTEKESMASRMGFIYNLFEHGCGITIFKVHSQQFMIE